MLNLPENELFSAYIDGELTAEEQAQVEEVLSSSAAARQLVDDLRSLSQSLQALPAYHLDNGLAESVLRRAERQMLSQPAAPLPEFHQVEPPRAERSSWARRLLRPRNFAWSAIAIAVALVLMMMESEKSSRPGSSPNGLAQSQRPEMLIEPAHNDAVIEAVEQPRKTTSEPAAVAASDAGLAKPVAEAAPEPAAPAIAAASPSELPPEPADAAARPAEPGQNTEDAKAGPLLVYECRSVDGPVGAEAVAEALKDCGVVLDRSSKVQDGEGLEVQLTPDQIVRVIARLQADSQRFSEIVSVPTAKHAGPRIPSAAREVATGAAAQAAAETAVPKAAARVAAQSANPIALEPKSAPAKAAVPAEATGIGASGAPRPGSAKSLTERPGAAPRESPVYRVRFLFKSTTAPDKETRR